MNKINEFIQSGLLEIYVMGICSPEEAIEVERMAAAHPQIKKEIAEISLSMEAYAKAHAVTPKATLKPLILATINYLERLKQGEPVVTPPILTPASQIEDYADWLNLPEMQLPADTEDVYAKIIGSTAEATTAIVWINSSAENEIHHDEYERFLIVEGACTITVGEEVHHFSPGDYFAVPLHTYHKVEVTSAIPCKVILQRLAA